MFRLARKYICQNFRGTARLAANAYMLVLLHAEVRELIQPLDFICGPIEVCVEPLQVVAYYSWLRLEET